MRRFSLSVRLTLALSGAALVLFGAVGAWQIAAEEQDLRRSFARDQRLLGRALQVAFENALRDRQAEDVDETLHELERIDSTVDVHVFTRAGQRIAASTGAREWTPPPLPSDEGRLRFLEDADPPVVEMVLPLQIRRGEPPATLVLVRPLAEMRADLDATRARVVLSVAAFVVVVTLMTMLLSHIWVGAPLGRMIANMRRVRAGDLSPAPSPPHRRDEVGATLREFEALVRDLGEAQQRLETEADQRRRLELALREVDKLATIGQLAAGLAHEIGSPLQILEGRLAALESKAHDPVEARRLAAIAREQSQRITRIVSRLMGVARRRAAPLRAIDPGPPLSTVVELLEGEARRRDVTVTLDVAADVPRICADPDAVQQLALNLVRNALDATEEGGTIEVRMERGTITRPDGALPSARMVVRDTGRGMSEASRAHAFEPFFTTRSPHGTGLGLAVVKGIVDDYQGRVELSSEEGRGTTFVVELPSEEETVTEAMDGTA